MKKFNGWESHLIVEALKNHIIVCENEIIDAIDSGNNPIFAQGFFKMQIEELIGKVESDMTRKEKKR